MVWNLDLDDFRGSMCDDGVSPLINHINKVWKTAPAVTGPPQGSTEDPGPTDEPTDEPPPGEI